MINELTKPEGYGYLCAGNLSEALQDLLNVKQIGSELKLIWNNQHYYQVIKDNNILPEDLDDYLNAECCIISFKTEFTMKRALKKLKSMGMTSEIICVDNYRDVILQQANYKRTGEFNHKTSHL